MDAGVLKDEYTLAYDWRDDGVDWHLVGKSTVQKSQVGSYTLADKGGSTEVTWAIHGQQPYIGKVISLFIDCDKMIGKDFEAGLANLKAFSETKLNASTS